MTRTSNCNYYYARILKFLSPADALVDNTTGVYLRISTIAFL